MVKRVGITHDVEERKAYWKLKYPYMTDWKIRYSGLTYEKAQEIEKYYIDKKRYKGGLGGEKKYGEKYSVYIFSY